MYLIVGISEIGVPSNTPFSKLLGHRLASAAYSTVLQECFSFLSKMEDPFLCGLTFCYESYQKNHGLPSFFWCSFAKGTVPSLETAQKGILQEYEGKESCRTGIMSNLVSCGCGLRWFVFVRWAVWQGCLANTLKERGQEICLQLQCMVSKKVEDVMVRQVRYLYCCLYFTCLWGGHKSRGSHCWRQMKFWWRGQGYF